MRKTLPVLLVACALLCLRSYKAGAQADTTQGFASKAISQLSPKSIDALKGQYRHLEDRLSKSTEKSIRKMQLLEKKLQHKLSKKDSLAAASSFTGVQQKYTALLSRLNTASTTDAGGVIKDYIPRMDSLSTALHFLEKIPGINNGKLDAINGLSGILGNLQQKFNTATDLKQFLKERKQQLKEQLEKYGLGKELKQLNKEVYYYQQQLNEYKAMLQSPDKLAEKALSVVRDLPAFKDFMNQHSELARFFRLPGSNSGNVQSLAGLQTRESVQQQIGMQLGGSVNTQRYLQDQVQQAETAMNKLKDKVNQLGGGSSDMEMPEFKPNTQKTKTFWKRMEYGLNIQSQKPNGWLPVTSDIALTAGYKLNDKSSIGVGASYKLGWGKNLNNISLSSQGVGLRSYVDMKLKGSIWLSGGYEYNYQHEFTKIAQLQQLDAWQKSGLLGLSKKYKVGKKQGKLQLLWDFLSYNQVPRTQPLKFRIGYVF